MKKKNNNDNNNKKEIEPSIVWARKMFKKYGLKYLVEEVHEEGAISCFAPNIEIQKKK